MNILILIYIVFKEIRDSIERELYCVQNNFCIKRFHYYDIFMISDKSTYIIQTTPSDCMNLVTSGIISL